ncbi:hypothetical protein GGU10DRAFT_336989 [Lentinula aff. detonsa]|uniref:Uncharacterized protein n=1 Tax=Lentinula aff. detonsa TaxID=2804958 RepID=A0AA38KLD7_9AGAR|nr:hypothetical protein GGU10DRAFT_336989 [Lentinula aff. detonsa]
MSTNLSSDDAVASTVQSPEALAIATFALPRPAPPPIVVPLFATTVRHRHEKVLAIHERLRLKPLAYHPYSQTKRPVNNMSTTSSSSNMSTTSLSSTEPDSPLTPIAEEYPADAVPGQTEPRVILVPPPLGPLTVSSLNLNTHVIRNYRLIFLQAIVKSAITEFKLDINRPLSEQEPKSRDEARTRKHNNASHYPHESALNPVSTFITGHVDDIIANPHKSSLLLFRTTCYPYSLVPFHSQQAASTLLLSTFPFIFHQLPVAMPRTVYAVCIDSHFNQASALTQLSIRGYHMSDTHNGSVPMPTAAPRSKSDTLRRPQIDYWLPPNAQAFIHDVTIMYHGERFRVYFRRYRMLPTNPLLKVNGGIVILRMGKQNPLNPINMQRGDTKKARAIARK